MGPSNTGNQQGLSRSSERKGKIPSEEPIYSGPVMGRFVVNFELMAGLDKPTGSSQLR